MNGETNVKVLIIAAHGSRRKESAMEVAALAKKLNRNESHAFDRVDHGFLQFSAPQLIDVIDRAVNDGAKQIIVFPLFISAGSHILTDIPEMVSRAGETYPDVEFSITRHLGVLPSVENAIVEEVAHHLAADEDQ